jgi:MraZ protein
MYHIGHSNITIDGKGRFLFPAKYRDALHAECGSELVVSHELKGCLAIYTKTYWLKKADAMATLPDDAQPFVAHFMSTSEQITLDSGGRLALTPELREAIALPAGPATLKGVGDYFELWTQLDAQTMLEQLKGMPKPESLRTLRIPR